MALPPEIAVGLHITGIVRNMNCAPHQQNPPGGITGNNVMLYEARVNCVHRAPAVPVVPRRPDYYLTDANPRNAVFVDNINNGVAVGLAPPNPNATYAFSDQFGGCQWHILSNGGFPPTAAYMHVYRGQNVVAPYNLGGGWIHMHTMHSNNVAVVHHTGSITAFTYRAGGANAVDCCMLHLDGHGRVDGIYNIANVQL